MQLALNFLDMANLFLRLSFCVQYRAGHASYPPGYGWLLTSAMWPCTDRNISSPWTIHVAVECISKIAANVPRVCMCSRI